VSSPFINLLTLNDDLLDLEIEAKSLGVPRNMVHDIRDLRRIVLPVIEAARDKKRKS
jgi:hypothetical protein